MFVVLGRLDRFQEPDPGEYRAGDSPGAFLGAVDQTEFQGIDPQLFGNFVHHGLCGERRRRSSWSPVSGGLGFIQHHVETFDRPFSMS